LSAIKINVEGSGGFLMFLFSFCCCCCCWYYWNECWLLLLPLPLFLYFNKITFFPCKGTNAGPELSKCSTQQIALKTANAKFCLLPVYIHTHTHTHRPHPHTSRHIYAYRHRQL